MQEREALVSSRLAEKSRKLGELHIALDVLTLKPPQGASSELESVENRAGRDHGVKE